jgi:hypothetical protein
MTAYKITVTRTITTEVTINNVTDRVLAEHKALSIAETLNFDNQSRPAHHNVLSVNPVPVTADNLPMPVGQGVYWNDPDDNLCGGWYIVKALPTLLNNDLFDLDTPIILSLSQDDGDDTETPAYAHEILSRPYLRGDWVIWSDNAAKLGNGYGYGYWDSFTLTWSNRAQATRYNKEDAGRINLPTSTGNDRKWVCDHLTSLKTLESLTDELAEFCRLNELKLQSADEMLTEPEVEHGAPFIRLWLNQFIEQWEAAEERDQAEFEAL